MIRNIASVLLLIVSFLMIFNGVLPHHHHEEEVCFVGDHCDDGNSHDHEQDDADHQHHDDTDMCQLNSLFITSYTFNQTTKKLNGPVKILLAVILFDEELPEVSYSSGSLDLIATHNPTKRIAASLCRALRAPPTA